MRELIKYKKLGVAGNFPLITLTTSRQPQLTLLKNISDLGQNSIQWFLQPNIFEEKTSGDLCLIDV